MTAALYCERCGRPRPFDVDLCDECRGVDVEPDDATADGMYEAEMRRYARLTARTSEDV